MKPIAWKIDVVLGMAGLVGVFGAFFFLPIGWLAMVAIILMLLRALAARL